MRPRYDVDSATEHSRRLLEGIQRKSGKSLEEWLALIHAHTAALEKDRETWLKVKHRLEPAEAAWLARHATRGPEVYDPEALVNEQYSGPKARLRPVYEEVLTAALETAEDVVARPDAKTVPLLRYHAFARIRARTRLRIDVELTLGGTTPRGRLTVLERQSKADRFTHRIGVEASEDVNPFLRYWLRKAYDRDEPDAS